jgi:HAD superfamily hydrolase (TIGR01509 family)
MKTISVVIFDCDGVMFDSRQANINYYNHLLAHFGLPPMTEKGVDFVHTHTADESVRFIFHGTPYLAQAHRYRMEMDYTPFIHDMKIEPGLRELLGVLKPKFGLAVATSRSNTIGKILERYGLEQYFDIVISSLDVRKPKPHPESVFKILHFFHIGPGEAVYLGDSIVDWETAKAAGVFFVSYRNEKLETPFKAKNMRDVVAVLDSIENHRLSL